MPFDGPMLGHEPGMPIHYDLHAWLWKQNPSGMFARWNPDGDVPRDPVNTRRAPAPTKGTGARRESR